MRKVAYDKSPTLVFIPRSMSGAAGKYNLPHEINMAYFILSSYINCQFLVDSWDLVTHIYNGCFINTACPDVSEMNINQMHLIATKLKTPGI